MPGGNLTTVEKTQRLIKIKELTEDGLSVSEIANEIGMSHHAVKRNVKRLDELRVSDLSPEQIAEKRSESYLELLEAALEARALFDKYKEKDEPLQAKRFFYAWLETIKLRQSLFGLDSVKLDNLTQINNITQYNQPFDRISSKVGDRIAKAIKVSHESKTRMKDLSDAEI